VNVSLRRATSPGGRNRWKSRLLLLVLVFVGACRSPGGRPNILFLLIDSLRADHVGFAGYTRPTTPCLDSLASQGAAFTTCIAQAPYTIASVPSLLTGLYPTSACYTAPVILPGSGGRLTAYRLGEAVRSIAAILAGHGYATAAFVANGDVALRSLRLAAEFAHVDADHLCSTGECADVMNSLALKWLAGLRAEPWFCYIHYMDVHYPYDAPREWAERFSPRYAEFPAPEIQWMNRQRPHGGPIPEELDHITGMYDAEIAYLDNRICRLLSTLGEMGLADDLLVIVASDHGDELYEHGRFGHKHTLYEELTRCPLLMLWPGHIPPGILVRSPVENVDVVPTILDVTGIRGRHNAEGFSLTPYFQGENGPKEAFSEMQGVSVRRGRWKLWHHPKGFPLLYDLDADPLETTNLADAEPDTLRSLQMALEAWAKSLAPPPPRPVELGTDSLDVDAVDMLRKLGYLE
jgi:arylsulfatase A-like enzyme